MIDSVRNTVLAVLNKHNFGYLTPSDFNLYAKQAQLDIFKGYLKEYNDNILDENLRKSGTDYADIRNKTEADIEKFFTINDLKLNSGNKFYLPSLTTTGDDLFKLNKVICYDTTTNPRTYKGEAEKVTHGKITMLNASLLTSPNTIFPAYVIEGDSISVYPSTSFVSEHSVEGHYIRMPKAPKWTYVTLSNGEAMFDQTQPDYQDFEVGSDDETMLVIKILQYAGMEIREREIYTVSKREELLRVPPEQPIQQQ